MPEINWTLINDLRTKPHPLVNHNPARFPEHARCDSIGCGEIVGEARTAQHLLDLAGIPRGHGYDSDVDARTYLLLAEVINLRERLDRITGWHSHDGPGGMVGDFCNECGQLWPCDTRRMAEGTYADEPDAGAATGEKRVDYAHRKSERCNHPDRRWVADPVFGSSGEGWWTCPGHAGMAVGGEGWDMSGEELAGTQKAAALHGVAINVAYNFRERFDAALEALVIYEVEYGKLWEGHEAISGVDLGGLSADQSFALGKLTGELMKNAEARGQRHGVLQAIAALQNVCMLSDWIEVRGFDPNNPSYWMGERAVQMLAEYLESLMQTEGQ